MAQCIQGGEEIEKGILCEDCLNQAVELYKLAKQDGHKRKTCLFCGAEMSKTNRKYTCLDPVCIAIQKEVKRAINRGKNLNQYDEQANIWRKEELELKKAAEMAAKKAADNIIAGQIRLAECERNAKAMGLSYGMYMAVRMKRLSPEHIRV